MPDHVTRVDMVFPSKGTQVLSALIHMLGTTILAHCLSRRLAQTDLSSWKAITRLTWPRACMLLIFLDSWLFLFSSGLLIFGIGLESSGKVCASAIFLCIAFYVTSKIFIYFFLIEKIHVVWQPSPGTSRFSSRIFIFCFLTVCIYMAVVVLMVVGKITHIQADGRCIIGLKAFSSIPLLSYDLFVNVLFTALFVWPILRSDFVNSFVRGIATRSMVGATVALSTSTVNITALTILHGSELGWVCLGCCGADVIVNALALFWVTSNPSSHDNTISFKLPEIHITELETASSTPSFVIPAGIPNPESLASSETTSTANKTFLSSIKSLTSGRRDSGHASIQITVTRENRQISEDIQPEGAAVARRRGPDNTTSECYV